MKVHEKPRRRIEFEDWEWAYLHDSYVQKAVGIDPRITPDTFFVASRQEREFFQDLLHTSDALRFKAGWYAHEQWCEVHEASFERDVSSYDDYPHYEG